MPDHTPAPGGVFLSYARGDTDAARRIADALRAFGVEVWFDQSELRGGDAWDAKLKKQIRECTLFVPIVSAGTQARGEGYFRREWKLAVERTHDMAAGLAFIVPVVIDDTAESTALVPDEFMRYQWTRLPNGVPTPQFVEQVKRLLGGKTLETGRPRPANQPRGGVVAPPPKKSVPPVALWISLGAVALSVGVVFFVTGRRERPAPVPPVETAKAAAPAPAPSPRVDKSIAVLPFANLSSEKENEFFADGVHDDVITNLAKIRDLKVISRTSVMAYRDATSRNLKKIAAELGVSTILEGSIRRVGHQVHMNAQLIDARTDEHLWADTFDGDTGDIFALQASLSQKIAAALKATLTPGERTLIERRPTQDQMAYELFLRGRVLEQGLSALATREQYDAIVAFYEQAIARDPDFALAHVNLTFVYGAMYWFGGIDPSPERRALAQAELKAAERLAPDAPETRYARGAFAYLCENDWNRALAEYRAAEASLPNDSRLQYLIGLTFRRLGRFQEALPLFDRSVSLNPYFLSSVTTQIETMHFLHRYPQALELVTRYLLMFPENGLLRQFQSRLRYALDGDQGAFVRARVGWSRSTGVTGELEDGYFLARSAGDLAKAGRILADPSLTFIRNDNGAINEPVALFQAGIARHLGDAAAARRFAETAVSAYRAGHWSERQQPLVRLGIARARAIAGQAAAEAADLQAAWQELAQRDQFLGFTTLSEVAETFAIIGRREEALACLRKLLAGPSQESASDVRDNPFFTDLKNDPRFSAILQLGKPL